MRILVAVACRGAVAGRVAIAGGDALPRGPQRLQTRDPPSIRVLRLIRRRGREAEGGGLLNRYTLSRGIRGSNPLVSAIFGSRSAGHSLAPPTRVALPIFFVADERLARFSAVESMAKEA